MLESERTLQETPRGAREAANPPAVLRETDRQRWVLSAARTGDPFDLLDGFELGADNRRCLAVTPGGAVTLVAGPLDDDLVLSLLQRELPDHS